MELDGVEFGRVIGVTGGMGCGKTTFAEKLWIELLRRGHEAKFVGADNLRYTMLCADGDLAFLKVRWALSERLGVPLGTSLEFDFITINDAIFASDASYAAYREIIRPAVVSAARDLLAATEGIVVLESALLLEDGFGELLDGPAVLVTCDEEVRQARVSSRESGTLTREMIEARISRQPTVEQRLATAEAQGVRLVRLDSTDEFGFRSAISAVAEAIAAARQGMGFRTPGLG